MSESKKPFTVSDRRHFTPEGDARTESSETKSAPEGVAEREGDRPAASSADTLPPRPVDFSSFILSLGAQASLLLGLGTPSGETAGDADLDGARSLIDILEMLRDKTEGRRTPEEDRILSGILYELRMAYLSKARAGGA